MIKEAVEKAGLSRVQLAKAAGISRDSLESWVAGRRQPRPGKLRRLAQALMGHAEALTKHARALLDEADRLDATDEKGS